MSPDDDKKQQHQQKRHKLDVARLYFTNPKMSPSCALEWVGLREALRDYPKLGGCPRIETVARETHFESDFSII